MRSSHLCKFLWHPAPIQLPLETRALYLGGGCGQGGQVCGEAWNLS